MTASVTPVRIAQRALVTTVTGPNPYVPGTGWIIDLTATFEWVDFVKLEPLVGSVDEATWAYGSQLVWALNNPVAGKVLAALGKKLYNKFTSVTNGATSTPAGVTVATVASSTAAGGAHHHALDHDHPQTTSDVPQTGGAGVAAVVGGVNLADHTHEVDIANFTGTNTPDESAHTHVDAILYDHTHTNTQAATVLSNTAYGAVDLSGTTFSLLAVGQ